jgi:hypothetical protein
MKIPKVTKIHSPWETKMRFDEVTKLNRFTHSLINEVGVEKLGMVDYANAYDQDIKVAEDIVNISRAQASTKNIDDKDTEIDIELNTFFGTIDLALKGSDSVMAEKARQLEILTRPYRGMQKLSYQRESQQLAGLLIDLKVPEAAALVTALSLTAVITRLDALLTEFNKLINQRIISRDALEKRTGSEMKPVLCQDFDTITFIIEARNFEEMSTETQTFINRLNLFIDELKVSVSRRLAALKKKKEEKDKKEAEKKAQESAEKPAETEKTEGSTTDLPAPDINSK